jgi:hypothetical protein
MEVSTYTPDSAATEFVQLLTEKYGSHDNFDFFLSDSKKALEFCMCNENVSFYPLAGRMGGEMKAHVALIVDKRLPAGEAFFGFVECPDDVAAFNALWDTLTRTAKEKGISVLKGPVNGSIWHQYRCIKESDGSPFFKAEPISETYYYDFFSSYKPADEILYYSASREPFDIVLKMIDKAALEKMQSLGFSIEEAKSVGLEEMRAIADISKTVFSGSWGYTELNEQEFMQLYSSEKMSAHLSSLYLLYKDGTIIGFCSTSAEDEKTLICKTICILPQFQGLGLGNALAYQVHVDAEKAGFKKMIYALIREGNNIQNFPKEEAVIFRRYATFVFNL